MVAQKLNEILVEVLGLEDDIQISPELDLVRDLAAESIDFVDICFRLEKEFKLGKVNPGDIFPSFLEKEDLKNGISENAMVKLRTDYPHLCNGLIEELILEKNPRIFLQVKNLISFVEFKLSQN